MSTVTLSSSVKGHDGSVCIVQPYLLPFRWPQCHNCVVCLTRLWVEGLDWRLAVKRQHYFWNSHHPVPPVQVGSSALSHVNNPYFGLSHHANPLWAVLWLGWCSRPSSSQLQHFRALLTNRKPVGVCSNTLHFFSGQAEVWSPKEGKNTRLWVGSVYAEAAGLCTPYGCVFQHCRVFRRSGVCRDQFVLPAETNLWPGKIHILLLKKKKIV